MLSHSHQKINVIFRVSHALVILNAQKSAKLFLDALEVRVLAQGKRSLTARMSAFVFSRDEIEFTKCWRIMDSVLHG